MTLKQRKFAREYVKNKGNATKAALIAYDSDYDNAQVIASHNMDKPVIIQEIDRLLKLTGENSDQWIANNLKKAVETGIGVKSTNSDAIKVLDMMLKVNNSYPTKKSVSTSYSMSVNTTTKDIEEIKQELKKLNDTSNSLLSTLTGQANS